MSDSNYIILTSSTSYWYSSYTPPTSEYSPPLHLNYIQ